MLEEFLNGNNIKYSYFEGSNVCCLSVSEAASASVQCSIWEFWVRNNVIQGKNLEYDLEFGDSW